MYEIIYKETDDSSGHGIYIWVLDNAGKFLTISETTGFSRRTLFHGVI
jgi:hypothetical protein